jgi:hypothetical protein
MNAAVKKQWVEALRSGKYQQGTEALCTRKDGQDQFCCLGVLCDLYTETFPRAIGRWHSDIVEGVVGFASLRPNDDGVDEEWNHEVLTPAVREWAGLVSDDPLVNYKGAKATVSSLNDTVRMSFGEIADAIERSL